jgi:hypothetical protein
MRQRLRSRLTYANVISTLALFLVLGGGTTLAATGGNFILGHANSANATTSLSAPIAGKGLQLTNTSTGAGATALGLNVASGHAPFTVNSGTKVANLNADKLDGMDATAFVPGSKLLRVGPATLTPPDNTDNSTFIATIGHFIFGGACRIVPSGNDLVTSFMISDVNHAAYSSLTQSEAGASFGSGDMTAGGGGDTLASIQIPHGTPNVNPLSGSAVAPDGQQVSFNLYQAVNARNHPGECMFGGTLALK